MMIMTTITILMMMMMMIMMMVIIGDAAPGRRGQGVAESWSWPHTDWAPVARTDRGWGHRLGPRGEAGGGQTSRRRRHHPLQVREQ